MVSALQLDLFGDHTSTWRVGKIRLYFASFAYILLCALRRRNFQQSELARIQYENIRTSHGAMRDADGRQGAMGSHRPPQIHLS